MVGAELGVAKFWKYLGNLAHQVFAISPAQLPQVEAVPAFNEIPMLARGFNARNRIEPRAESRVEKERHREPAAPRRIDHPVQRGGVTPRRQTLEHVADVHHERAG